MLCVEYSRLSDDREGFDCVSNDNQQLTYIYIAFVK